MKTIHKYVLDIRKCDDVFEVQMPQDAEVLSFNNQLEKFCIWALVDTDKPRVTRKFGLMGTGRTHSQPDKIGKFIGTALFEHGIYVFHLFEMLP